LKTLLNKISQCTLCAEHLPLGPRPIVAAHKTSKILIIGQAPGIKVHESGVAWNDASGKQLRQWLGVSEEQFYNPKLFAIVPMGFCYPGKGQSGDLPPRPECAPQWHTALLKHMSHIKLTLLIGQYAQKYSLKDQFKKNLTETVKAYKEYLPKYFVLPHPSPRNRFWLRNNLWFIEELLPVLKSKVQLILKESR